MKRAPVAWLLSLALLSLGVGGCHTEGGPCCGQGNTRLVTDRNAEPCCEPSAPLALPEASGPSTTAKFSVGAPAVFATAPFDLAPLEARAALTTSAARPRPLYQLDCALRL